MELVQGIQESLYKLSIAFTLSEFYFIGVIFQECVDAALINKILLKYFLNSWKNYNRGEIRDQDEIVRWHHQLHEQESEQTPRESGGQSSLACCSPWGLKESDMT